MQSKNVTIIDIAEKVNVSIATVDRVLHNRGRVSEETRNKILKAIEDLEYKPNLIAQTLALKKVYTFAVIYHNKETLFWDEVISGIKQAEEELYQFGVKTKHYVLSKANVDEQVKVLEEIINLNPPVDGLALVPYHSSRICELLNIATEKGIRVVTFNTDENCNRLCFVGQDMKKSGRVAGYLMGLMCKENSKIAILTASQKMKAIQARAEGFEEAIRERYKSIKLLGTYDFDQDNDKIRSLTEKLLKEGVDGIFVTNIYVNYVADILKELGLKDEIKLIGYDLTKQIADHLRSGFITATICQEPQKQGYMPLKILYNYITKKESNVSDYFTKIEIVTKENIPTEYI